MINNRQHPSTELLEMKDHDGKIFEATIYNLPNTRKKIEKYREKYEEKYKLEKVFD